jgi:hypothetical protein
VHSALCQVVAVREGGFVIEALAELVGRVCLGLQCAAAGVEALTMGAFHVGLEFEECAQPFDL